MEPILFRLAGYVSYASVKSAPYINYAWSLLFKLPDSVFVCPNSPKILSKKTHSEVKILYANNGKNDITNKFNIFLRLYWDTDLDAFDYIQYINLFNSDMLTIKYRSLDSDEMHYLAVYRNGVNVYYSTVENGDILSYMIAPFSCIEI
jgi:hypothetical protein